MPAFGQVVGRLVTLVVDTNDPDQNPDLVPLAGKVTFTLNVPRVNELAIPQVIASTPLVAILDENGYLATPDGSSSDVVLYQGVNLPANNDPGLNPTDTQYTVSYSLTVKGTTTQVAIPNHLLVLPAGTTIDLATMIPPASAPPMSIAQAEALLALAVRTVNGVEPDSEGNVDVAGGGGAVDSVNGQTGVVVLSATDVGAVPVGQPITIDFDETQGAEYGGGFAHFHSPTQDAYYGSSGVTYTSDSGTTIYALVIPVGVSAQVNLPSTGGTLVTDTNLRLPIVMTQAEFDGITPVDGQVYITQG